MTGSDWQTLAARAKESPFWVLPISKGGRGNYLTLVLQAQLPNVLITTLEEYRQ